MLRFRWVLALAGAVSVAAAVLVSVGAARPAASPTAHPQRAAARQAKYIEPPALASEVASGKLPPIAQRLPAQPFVVGPGTLLQEKYMKWQDGQYGGTLNYVTTGPPAPFFQEATILNSPGQTTAASTPDIVSAFSYSKDYRTFRFTIRPGLKWSDGVPVTTADVAFTFKDIYGTPSVEALEPWPDTLCTQGNCNLGHASLKVIDKYTFQLTFGKPYGYFIADLNSWIPGYDFLIKPAHYLKQFDAKYANKAKLASLVKANNKTSWQQLLVFKDDNHWASGNPEAIGMPVLNPWVVTSSTTTQVVYQRNPYYFQVDSHGRQLPYIDKIVNTIASDTNAQTNAELAGQASVASGGDTNLFKMPVYEQNAKRGGYRVFLTGSFNNPICLYLNLDYQYTDKGSAWQKLVSDPQHRFGRAVSLAMNPADVNKSVYFGLYGKPFFNTAVHDPAEANKLLDSLGMKKVNGWRTGPDGKPFTLRITYAPQVADFDPVAELLQQQLQSVGIKVQLESINVNLFNQRATANQLQAALSWNDGPSWENGMSEDFEPNQKGAWSPETWAYYTSQGKQGRKPTANIQRFYDLETAWKAYPPESAKGEQLFSKLLNWMKTNYVFMPTVGKQAKPNIVDTRLRNVPKAGAPDELDTYINDEGMWFASK